MRESVKDQFIALLRSIFQCDHPELDFGVYRLINFHQRAIQHFIDHDLIEAIEQHDTTAAVDPKAVYNHLLTFFSRYYHQGELITQRRYGREHKYAIPYNGEETYFYWVSREQYFIKSGEIFPVYRFRLSDLTIEFVVEQAVLEKGNRKAADKNYFFPSDPLTRYTPQNRCLRISFQYRAPTVAERHSGKRSRRQEQLNQAILSRLIPQIEPHLPESKTDREDWQTFLQEQLSRFTRKQQQDFFIHKDLAGFLQRELDWYLKNETLLLDLDQSGQLATAMKLLRAVRETGEKIIRFLAHLEGLKKRLWEKKSLVLKSEFVITLQRLLELVGEEEFQYITHELAHCPGQLREWQEAFKLPRISSGLGELVRKKKWRHLPLDTQLLTPELRQTILAAISARHPLDEVLDGVLLNSDNWAGLRLLGKRYHEKVKTIYIDPPFNKEKEADYFYKVGYKDATWNTFLENRLTLARDFLRPDGCIFVRCDYNGSMYVRWLLNDIFGKENFRNELVINRTLAKQTVASQFVVQTESLFLYGRTEQFTPNQIERPTEPVWHPLLHFPRKDERPRVILGQEFYPPPNRRWALSQKRIDAFAERGKVRINTEVSYRDCRGKVVAGMPELLYDSEVVGNEWLDIPGYAQRHHFPTENAEALLKRVIQAGSQAGDRVMDFFLGSGTTIAVAQKMGRRWIGMELGEHFYTVVLPRMKQVLFGDTAQTSRDLKWHGGGFFKYQVLEQFDDVLENINLGQSVSSVELPSEVRFDFLFEKQFLRGASFYDLHLARDPFNYRLRVLSGNAPGEHPVDLPETTAYLLGLEIDKTAIQPAPDRTYLVMTGRNHSRRYLLVWRSLVDLDFQRDRQILEQIAANHPAEERLVNGDSAATGFASLDPIIARALREPLTPIRHR